jgi:two-component system chemotaxis sensor kinase CheA
MRHSTCSKKKTLHQLEKVSKEIQDISMSLRMVPVKPTFQKMQRIVRDTAQALGKDVAIQLVGEETELDKTVLEKINDPLVHLIRNSVDHGIENSDIRTSKGKSAKGKVTLSAFHRSGKLILEVSDDGGGLDPQKLMKKAVEKGILKSGTQLSDKDAFNLIFAPGFSTKEVVTDVSGRGVGMDVVRTNITDLSGEIFIDSVLGKGTTFQIVLPLTLAIIEGMMLTYAGDRYVIPFGHIFETFRPSINDVQWNTGLGHVLMLRGENMPVYRLGDFFGKKSNQKTENMIAAVIRTGHKPFAILVDDILGHSQVVVKQLGSELKGFKGVSGCTILGDGKPALILEPMDLIKRPITLTNKPDSTLPLTGGKAA